MVKWQGLPYDLSGKKFSFGFDKNFIQTIKSVEFLMLSAEHAEKLLCMHEENKTIKERTKD